MGTRAGHEPRAIARRRAGLGADLCPEELRDARGRCLVSVVGLQRGEGAAPLADSGFLVIRGVLTRRVEVGDRSSAELLGRGDVIHPAPGESAR